MSNFRTSFDKHVFFKVGWKTRSAECGVRSMENEEYGKCGVWKMRSMESAECGKCGVWKMWSMENAEYSVWKCINFFIQHKKCLEMVYS